MKRIVFVDVDDTLLGPPYDAVKRVARILRKPFPSESEFQTRSSIHFDASFPQVFRSPAQMWAMAFLALPLGYFKSHKPTDLDIQQTSDVLKDNRVYLISKNPPSFTRWRVQRINEIFRVNIGERYIACGPIFKKGPTKISIMTTIAASRGVSLSDCLLIDDSTENIQEAREAGMQCALVRSTWNADFSDIQDPGRLGIATISTQQIPEAIQEHLSDELHPDTLSYFIVPPLSLRGILRLAWVFCRRKWLYSESFPTLEKIIPVARNPWTSFLFRDPHRRIMTRIQAVLQNPAVARNVRVLSFKAASGNCFLPLRVETAIEVMPEKQRVQYFRQECRESFEAHGHEFVSQPMFYFEELDRKAEIERLVQSERVTGAVTDYIKTHAVSFEEGRRLAREYANEIATGRTYRAIQEGLWVLNTVFRKTFKTIQVRRHPSVKALESTHFLIYASTHRSYLDSGILFTVLAKCGRAFPFIVGADKMKKIWMGKLAFRGGTFFIRRKFVDVIYSSIIAEHLMRMQSAGSSLEVFLEGQRSRSGLTLQPKKGIASIVWDNMQSDARDVAIVPVSFAYNKLPESELLLRESFEERKSNNQVSLREIADIKIKSKRHKTFLDKLRSRMRRLRSSPISECYIEIAEPIIFERRVEEQHVARSRLQEYLSQTMFRINASTMALPSSILCLAVLSEADRHVTRAYARSFLDLSRQLLSLYALPVAQMLAEKTDLDAFIEDFSKLPFVNRKFKRSRVQEDTVLSIEDLDTQRAAYYKNNILHFFVLPSIISYILLDSRSGRVESLYRYFAQVYPSLRSKYLIPLPADANKFLSGLLDLYKARELLVMDKQDYLVNMHADDYSLMQNLADIGHSILRVDSPELFESVRRSYQRVDVQLPARMVSYASGDARQARVLGLSELGFFLACDSGPVVGDRIKFYADGDANLQVEGDVIRCDIDGVAVRSSSGQRETASVGADAERRRSVRTENPISGRFVFSRSLDEIQIVTNLSPSGAFIVTENLYGIGDYLACTLESNGQSVPVQGQVTRTSESGVGVRFHGLSDEKAALLLLIVAEQQNRGKVSNASMLS